MLVVDATLADIYGRNCPGVAPAGPIGAARLSRKPSNADSTTGRSGRRLPSIAGVQTCAMKEPTMSYGNLRSRFTHNVPLSVHTEAELRAHLPAVDTPLLLVCAVHVTGDSSLLDRFADKVGS